MDYEKKQPTADCIVARLVPSWGSIVSLLFKAKEPYEHYYDEHGEEVPNAAIASWTDVELPPESEDEKIKKTAIKILRGVAHRVFEHEGVSKDSVLAYVEKQEEQKPTEWSDNFEENIRNLLNDKLTWHSEDGSMSSTVSIDDKTLKDIISGIWFYVGKEALKYPNKQLNVEQKPVSGSSEKPNNHKEWSEKDKAFLTVAIAICNKYSHKDIADWLKSLQPQPHWKPSEEQMNYLCAVVDEAKRRHNISVSGYLPARSLESLYNDLKKLM